MASHTHARVTVGFAAETRLRRDNDNSIGNKERRERDDDKRDAELMTTRFAMGEELDATGTMIEGRATR